MVLKAYVERTFKANISFEDESVKEVTFRLPRNTDIYQSEDGNTNLNNLYTLANMIKPFDKPVQVETQDGSILNIYTVRELVNLGVKVDMSEVAIKWIDEAKKVEEEKARIVKKSQSAGNSTKKDTPETKG